MIDVKADRVVADQVVANGSKKMTTARGVIIATTGACYIVLLYCALRWNG